MKLLLVEDDQKLAETVTRYLTAESYVTDVALTGQDALEMLEANHYDLLVLDWELPGPSGLELCLRFRRTGGKSPVLFLTGRTQLDDLATAYESGADDYLRKPFQMLELILRVQALLKRSGSLTGSVLRAGALLLDSQQFTVRKNGAELRLSQLEFELLQLFMRNPGRLFTPDELMEALWSKREDRSDNALRACLKKLRSKIDDPQAASFIQNIHGIGYKFLSE